MEEELEVDMLLLRAFTVMVRLIGLEDVSMRCQ